VAVAADEIGPALTAELARQWEQDVEVVALRRLSGGASMETWSLDVRRDAVTVPAILRCDRRGAAPGGAMRVDRPDERRVLELVHDRGVPVPAVLAGGDRESALGMTWLLMERLEGETIARKLLRDDAFASARPLVTGQCARALAGIHTVTAAEAVFLGPPRDAESMLREQLDLLDMLGEPSPAFEFGVRWLLGHLPPPVEPALVHGDFRTGNLMIGPDGLRGVLDWELAHVGDPREDLGWFCVRAWRFGNDAAVAGGFGSREELVTAYAEASGRDVDIDAVRFWETCGTLRWGIMCMVQAAGHLSGAVRSVELAAIGRRVSENEHDLLELIAAAAG
jgi:aminoglycoside phosphotransferase (APT) family kinase protein